MTADELQSELESLCVEWQKVLRLQDWIVDVEIHYNNSKCATCDTVTNRKLALIRMCHPDALSDPDDKDYEATLVHELMHIGCDMFDGKIPRDTAEWASYEQMIDLTANALVSLKRSK
jgi:hypothetical protein